MPPENIERTPEAQRHFNGMTTPVTSASTPSRLNPAKNGAAMDPFQDDTPLECGLENPEECESCQ